MTLKNKGFVWEQDIGEYQKAYFHKDVKETVLETLELLRDIKNNTNDDMILISNVENLIKIKFGDFEALDFILRQFDE